MVDSMLPFRKSFDFKIPGSNSQVPVAPITSYDKNKLLSAAELSKSSFDIPLSQIIQTQGKYKRDAAKVSAHPTVGGVQLRSVEEIPRQFQRIFKFPYFNILQSKVLDEVLYTDKSMIVSAPTGSGKTVVFELALIRLIMKAENTTSCGKIIYMAPMKALCSERFLDWKERFSPHGLSCLEVTGDSEIDDLEDLFRASLIFTTPEKWDSMSRRWKDNKQLFRQIKLFFIDEIHILNDRHRGATVEAVVSRMKTLETSQSDDGVHYIRFIAVSATMPNYNDIASWLSHPCKAAFSLSLGDNYRPVRLDRVVLGYPFKEGTSEFRFDMNLSYRLKSIIETYSHSRPTLVFCSSRKSVLQTAEVLTKDINICSVFPTFNSQLVYKSVSSVHEHKLCDFLKLGIGIHHAGLHLQDRQIVEELFRSSQLPVLVCTSTLSMGVNLPAHLVVIKSTHFYNMGIVQEYSDMQILQMIGRAGRPQFDTFAVSVIMTKSTLKSRYESLVNGTQLIESSLHKNLIEHLNAEIVLQTISNTNLVKEWLKQTFLYVRALKNPKYYGLPINLEKKDVEKKLTDLCLQSLTLLKDSNLVLVNDETGIIFPTDKGRLMARYCVAYKTIKHFHQIAEKCDSIADMLSELSHCSEFEDIQLRTNEKKILNTLNKDKNKETIRFPLPGKIKTGPMKVNCLIQAQLSCLTVSDFSLSQDISKIFRVGQRLMKCLMEFLLQGTSYSVILYSVLLYKSFRSKLWFDSRYVTRQLDGIGPAMSLALANAGLISFQKLEQANARDIELIVNRHPPFGNQVLEAISALPKYQVAIEQLKPYKPHKAILTLIVDLLNHPVLETKPSSENNHQSLLIVGDSEDKLVLKWRINDSTILRCGSISQTFEVKRCRKGKKLDINLLSQSWVGIDIHTDYEPVYTEDWFDLTEGPATNKAETPSSKLKAAVEKYRTVSKSQVRSADSVNNSMIHCHHRCLDKSLCGHKCCKQNNTKRTKPQRTENKQTKVAKIEGSAYFGNNDFTVHNDNMKQNKPAKEIKEIAKIHTPYKKQLVKDCSQNLPTSFPENTLKKSSESVSNNKVSKPTWNEQHGGVVKENEEICFDLFNDDDDFNDILNDPSIEGNQQLLDATLPNEVKPSSKTPSNLDITVNGWADLDAFKLGREEHYRNGQPPHLLDSYSSDCPLESDSFGDVYPVLSHQSSGFNMLSNDFCPVIRTSGESLGNQGKKTTNISNSKDLMSDHQINKKDNFYDVGSYNSQFAPRPWFGFQSKAPSNRSQTFFQGLKKDKANDSSTLYPKTRISISDSNRTDASSECVLSQPSSPIIDVLSGECASLMEKMKCLPSSPKTFLSKSACQKKETLQEFIPSHDYDQEESNNRDFKNFKKNLPVKIDKARKSIFFPQNKLSVDDQQISNGLFDGIF